MYSRIPISKVMGLIDVIGKIWTFISAFKEVLKYKRVKGSLPSQGNLYSKLNPGSKKKIGKGLLGPTNKNNSEGIH